MANASDTREGPLLSSLEKSIVSELERDPRITNRELADRLQVNISQIVSRTRRLEERQLARVVAVLSIKNLGQSLANIRIVVHGRSIADVAREVGTIPVVGWLGSVVASSFDLAGSARYRSMEDIEELHKKIGQIIGIASLRIDLQLKSLVFRHHHIAFTPRPRDQKADFAQANAALEAEISGVVTDPLDRHIIAELCHNGRTSSRELARRYGVNPGTIRNRVRALEASGLLGLHTLVDPAAVGLHVFAIMEIEIAPCQLDAAVEQLKDKWWLPHLMLVTGQYSLMGIMLVHDRDEAESIRVHEIRTLEGVKSVKLAILNRNYTADPRFS